MTELAKVDGEETGESVSCGNTATKGHSKSCKVIEAVPVDGRPCIGDPGAKHFDGHTKTTDRSKDTTTLGGENTLSTEAENAPHKTFET